MINESPRSDEAVVQYKMVVLPVFHSMVAANDKTKSWNQRMLLPPITVPDHLMNEKMFRIQRVKVIASGTADV